MFTSGRTRVWISSNEEMTQLLLITGIHIMYRLLVTELWGILSGDLYTNPQIKSLLIKDRYRDKNKEFSMS